MSYNFTFNSRETYLQYKAEWKQRYLTQSQRQRELKRAIGDADRTKGHAMMEHYNYKDGVKAVHELISERHASKIEAGRQWESKHI